ncbi:S26 family signal peptidase [Hyphomonas sp. CY54-11-8]|uniref:S26 family signal peptidase n=1 Tax=Hyphomonas sp. CY54-11-8 TaxID=1280944 RepID=UPI0018CC56AD|nr:S26 family signal peptidase [Hyphomonas sp. CY54-11-8]
MTRRDALLAMGCGLSLMLGASVIDRSDFVWNRTESVPRGLYFVDRSTPVSKGDLVAFEPSDEVRKWLDQEGIVGSGWPLLKHVSALEGDEICRCGVEIFINGSHVADALETTGSGALPAWQGCRMLQSGEVFLLNDHPRSVDGRYFGAQLRARILGIARPIWTYSNRPAEYQADDKAVESGSGKASGSRRARLRECHPATLNPLSAHPFLCDSAPEGGCTDLQSAARLEP